MIETDGIRSLDWDLIVEFAIAVEFLVRISDIARATPHTNGGADPDNLQAAHLDCNSNSGALSLD